ncbi:MAG TPA: DUF1996 domain-containing protein [Gaiellaceae bacterium]|nr:DUF1996 domain-containing protein [Gaiellaceae bacterium]
MSARVLAAAVAGLVLVGAASAALATPPGRDRGQPLERADLVGVTFVETCGFSHRAPDDPIVAPGRPGASHDHTFFGNRTTNAHSTFGSLVSAGTTCRNRADTAAYWVPTLLRAGEPVLPLGATVYYRRSTLAQVRPFPNGFRMIAGDASATSPQPLRTTFWSCGLAGGVPPSSTIPTCPQARGSFLRLHLRFPSCWDGRRLDAPDHRSHMAYPLRGVCPPTHPVAVPAIALVVRYPVTGGDGFSLASGGVFSAHGDFFNAWRPGALRRLVERCLNALVHCGRTG